MPTTGLILPGANCHHHCSSLGHVKRQETMGHVISPRVPGGKKPAWTRQYRIGRRSRATSRTGALLGRHALLERAHMSKRSSLFPATKHDSLQGNSVWVGGGKGENILLSGWKGYYLMKEIKLAKLRITHEWLVLYVLKECVYVSVNNKEVVAYN